MYYMELLDENPDSTDTMTHLGECQFRPSDVVQVDGKPYEHLMKVQKTTWVRASNLLVFPGDWRTLKTLTPSEKYSNFEIIHHFLLQAWQAIYRQMINAYLINNKDILAN